MAEKKKRERSEAPQESQPGTVVSLRLEIGLARAFKTEAARRGKRLNALFEEMWNIYRERHDVAS